MKDWMRSKMGKPWERNKAIKPINPPKKQKRKRKRAATVNPHETSCRKVLGWFWKKFETLPNTAMRLELLKETANPKWERVSDALRMKLRRDFTKRYAFFLAEIDGYCGCCGDNFWMEKHHIIPLSHGGINENINLLAICQKCHDEIHPWMKGV